MARTGTHPISHAHLQHIKLHLTAPATSQLHFENDLDRMVSKCSVGGGAEMARSAVRDYLVDGMAYSLAYHEAIQKAVIDQLNYRWRAFMKKNPEFDGKVHILAHSLGSVITFDVLSTPDLRGQLKMVDKIKNCWSCGSPLATFALLRLPDYEAVMKDHNERMKSMEESGISYFNMFMEQDAIACRIEPLVAEKYADSKPVTVMKWDHRILLSDPNAVGPRGPSNHKDPTTGVAVEVIYEGSEARTSSHPYHDKDTILLCTGILLCYRHLEL